MSDTAVIDTLSPPPSELDRLDARFPARRVPVGDGAVVSVRECGTGPALVCLHGIGSGTASLLASRARLIAWDAPGYGESTPVAPAVPTAADYAARLHGLLDALEIES